MEDSKKEKCFGHNDFLNVKKSLAKVFLLLFLINLFYRGKVKNPETANPISKDVKSSE